MLERIYSGPWLSAAYFCEKVLHEQDGVLSTIRIIDRFVQSATGPDAQEDMPPFKVDLFAFISLKAGTATGRHTLLLRMTKPDGTLDPASNLLDVQLSEGTGANAIIRVQFLAEMEGMYWFDLRFDDQLLTRMPLSIVYLRNAQQMRQTWA